MFCLGVVLVCEYVSSADIFLWGFFLALYRCMCFVGLWVCGCIFTLFVFLISGRNVVSCETVAEFQFCCLLYQRSIRYMITDCYTIS